MSTERVTFKTRSGSDFSGEIALPAGDTKGPAVVLLQEWWGVNDHIRSLLTRLAADGFVAFAPDLYKGVVAADAHTAQALMNGLDWPEALDAIAGAGEFLAAHGRSNGHVGLVGFCMGGALSLAASTIGARFEAIVPFYGAPGEGKADYSKVKAPMMGHFALHDDWVSPALVEKLTETLRANGVDFTVHNYDANHAFANDTRPEVYSPECAALAWSRTVTFFREKLSG